MQLTLGFQMPEKGLTILHCFADRKPSQVVQDCLVDLCLCCTSCVDFNENVNNEDNLPSRPSPPQFHEFPKRYESRIPMQTVTTPYTNSRSTIIISDAFDEKMRKHKKKQKKVPYSRHYE